MKKFFIMILAAALLGLGLVAFSGSMAANATSGGDDQPCVPSAAYDEVIHHDAVTHVVHHDAVTHQEKVVDTPAVSAVWANFSPNDSQATFIGPAIWPTDGRGTWNVHDQLPPGQEGPDGVYANGNPDKGGNWFYRHAGTPEVSHMVTVVDHAAYNETVVDEEAYNETVHHDAVTCDDNPKPWVCHPVNGKGELGNGWDLIDPDHASSHIDESQYPDGVYWKHTSKDGRHDIYATPTEGGYTCPGDQVTEVTPNATGVPDDCDADPFGTITVDAVEGVTYTLQDGSVIEGTIAANGTNTVTAHVSGDFVFADDVQTVWEFTSNPATDCPGGHVSTPVSPELPTVVNGDCTDLDGSLTLPVTEGITYTLEGNVLTAAANDDFVLDLVGTTYTANESGTAFVTVTLPTVQDESECGSTPPPTEPPVVNPPPNTPPVNNPPVVNPPAQAPPVKHKHHAPPAVPTAVEGGL